MKSKLLVVFGIILCLTGTFAALASSGSSSTPEPAREPKSVLVEETTPSALALPQPQASPPLQTAMTVELITLTPLGFEPNVIKRPAGRVLLAINNRNERDSTALRFERENGALLGQAQVPRNRRHWRVPVTLPPGRYRIIDSDRPNIVCNIEITP